MDMETSEKYYWIHYLEKIEHNFGPFESRIIKRNVEVVCIDHPIQWMISCRNGFKDREFTLLNWKEIPKYEYESYKRHLNL